MEFSKPGLTVGLACVGTALLAMLGGDRRDVNGGPEAAAPPSDAYTAAEPSRVSQPAPASMLGQKAASDAGCPELPLAPQVTAQLQPKPPPAEIIRSSAPLRPKPRPEVDVAPENVAAPRPRPRDPVAEVVARGRTEWPRLGDPSEAPVAELAARRARLLERAESLVEAPPRSLRNATALTCLAVSVYHEARNQPDLGQHAVAAAILRRAEIPHRWEDTVCEVVQPIQFSYLAPDLGFAEIDEPEAWREAVAVAVSTLLHGPHPDLAKADHYHRLDVDPAWNKPMKVVARVADHVFFRDPRSQRIE